LSHLFALGPYNTLRSRLFLVVALCNAGAEHEDHESDDLKMDYFYQDESEAAALMASATSTLAGPRRLHQSAATLPVTPVVEDSAGDRHGSVSRKSEKRKRNTMPPSYVEPFVRPRQGFITARRDKELFTRSSGYLADL